MLEISLDKAIYAPADTIKVSVTTDEKDLQIKFSGKVTIYIHKTEFNHDNDQNYHDTFFELVRDYDSEDLSFKIPPDSISSVMLKDVWSFSFAEVKFEVSAVKKGLLGFLGPKRTVPVIIRKNKTEEASPSHVDKSIEFYPWRCAWCCCIGSSGYVRLELDLQSATLNPGDQVTAQLVIDNGDNNADIQKVEIMVIRRWHFQVSGDTCFGESAILSQAFGGLAAHNVGTVSFESLLPLAFIPTIRYASGYNNVIENRSHYRI